MIAARPETIFRYFTDPARFARRMGQGSVLDPSPAAYPLADHRHGPAVDRRARVAGRSAPEAWHGLVHFRWVTGFWDPPAPPAGSPAESSGRLEQA